MKNKIRYLIREEYFGYTVYDCLLLTQKYLINSQIGDINTFLKNHPDYQIVNYNLEDGRRDLLVSPTRVYFEITRKCNLHCISCFNNSGECMKNEMNTEEIKKTIRGLKKDGVFEIRFSGGEPTMCNDWYELLKYAKEIGLLVSLNTNGIFDIKEIERLSELNLDQITISLDGNKEIHEKNRGKRTFDKVLNSLRGLNKRKQHLRINTLLNKDSVKCLREILDIANKYVEEINFFYVRPIGRALENKKNLLTYQELVKVTKELEKLKRKYKKIRILFGSQVMLRNSISSDDGIKLKIKMSGPDGSTRINILADGSIWPGGYTPHIDKKFYLGNIIEEGYTLKNIWHKSRILDKFRKIDHELKVRCSNCSEQGINCPGSSMEMELFRLNIGNKKNPYCKWRS